jgi:hypothetical protein
MVRGVCKRLRHLTGVAILVVWTFVPLLRPAIGSATPPIAFTGPSTLSGTTAAPVSIAPIQLTGSAGTNVSIQLRVHAGELELTNTSGVDVTTDNPAAVLSFDGTVSTVNTALTHVQYTRTSGLGDDTLEASTVGANQVYYPGNGHVYEVVEYDEGDEDPGVTWNTAQTQAASQTYNGLTGYLTTITSAEENNYVGSRLSEPGWMGASDSAVEGTWKWMGGPETGQQFWSGASGGSAVGGRYSNWSAGEPNNAGNEDCAQFLSGGSAQWNDLPCSGAHLPAYVVEFGEDGSLPSVATKDVTITVAAATRNVASCDELNDVWQDSSRDHDIIRLTADIDCEGATVDPIFSYNGFFGTFDGQGHTIRNFNINGIDTSYSEGNSAGLFVYTNSATIKNLHIEGGTVSGYNGVGGLIGWAEDTDVENVTSSMTIEGQGNDIGGLIGGYQTNNPSHHVTGSSATGEVSGETAVGGLIGEITGGSAGTFTLEQSFATGNASSVADEVGGLIGSLNAEGWDDPEVNITIQDVYAQGNAASTDGGGEAGGLIGEFYVYQDGAPTHISLTRAYASGSASGAYDVGGLIGYLRSPDDADATESITSTFAAGHVTSDDTESAGGLIGYYRHQDEDPTWSDNYFDQTRTGTDVCSGNFDIGGCHPKNTDGTQATYFYRSNHAPMTDWDFSTIWVAHANTYPTFDGEQYVEHDDDGATDAVESAAPNGGDANGDLTPDSEQTNVTSLVDPVSGKYAVLATTGCEDNTGVTVGGENANTKADDTYSYPAGLMNFTLGCSAPGATATVTQYYYGDYKAKNYVLRKYNNTTHAYQTVADAVLTNVIIGSQPALKIVYNITDGGALDMDGTANGVIVDPAGPALAGSLTDTGTNVLIISTMSTVLLAGAVMTRRWKFAATVPSEPRRIPVRFE